MNDPPPLPPPPPTTANALNNPTGVASERGHGTASGPDPSGAAAWFAAAAELGHAPSMGRLGQLHRRKLVPPLCEPACSGDGGSVDRCGSVDGGGGGSDAEALRWLTRGAALGDAASAAGLALLHARGLCGAAPDDAKALALWRTAAEKGHADAMCNLGTCYAHGIGGLAPSPAEAVAWWEMAAAEGHPTALRELARHRREAEEGSVV